MKKLVFQITLIATLLVAVTLSGGCGKDDSSSSSNGATSFFPTINQ